MLSTARNVLLAYIAFALTLSIVQANGNPHHLQRDHVNLKRVIRKRGPAPQTLVAPVGAGQDPTVNPPASSSAAIIASASTTSASSVVSSPTPSASSTSGPFLGGIIPVALDSLLPLGASSSLSQSTTPPSTSASLSASSTSSSTSSTTTSAPLTSEALNLTAAPSSTSTPTRAIVTLTRTDEASQATEDVPAPVGAAKTKSTTLMILIIIASSVGGIAILWTIFRKWKLGRSSRFDERLQPIDWQPTDDKDDGIIPAHRRAPSIASSFHSGPHPNATGGYGSTSDHGHNGYNRGPALQPIPDHDFTAGAIPVGAGYADLARGPSPPMTQATHGVYGDYNGNIPFHNQYNYQA